MERKNLNVVMKRSCKGKMRCPCGLALEIFTMVARGFLAREAPKLLFTDHKYLSFLASKDELVCWGSKKTRKRRAIQLSDQSMGGTSFNFLDSKIELVRWGSKKTQKRRAKKKAPNPSNKHKNNSNNILGHPELPMEFKAKIQELEGCEVKLVIEKDLFKSDLNPNNGRFSIPIKQIREEAKNFLTEIEKSSLNERRGENQRLAGLPVLVLDPTLKHCNMCLKKWDMAKTTVYNITNGWNDVVRINHLEAKDTMQLWSFRRSSQNQLCFAMVKL